MGQWMVQGLAAGMAFLQSILLLRGTGTTSCVVKNLARADRLDSNPTCCGVSARGSGPARKPCKKRHMVQAQMCAVSKGADLFGSLECVLYANSCRREHDMGKSIQLPLCKGLQRADRV